ncbi:hypothetical protein CsatA_013206 [Cannabis sativa]
MSSSSSYNCSSTRRQRILLLWLFIFTVVLFIFGQCDGSRNPQVFKFKPKSSQLSGHFMNFLPKRFPIPKSGPSRKHNDIGLQSWRSAP